MLYLTFLILNALEMLVEVGISAKNSAQLAKQGAIEIGPKLLPVMAAFYGLMYAGSFLEYSYFPKTLSVVWATSFLSVYILAKVLKFWAVWALGASWTMKVLIIPGSRVAIGGPYRWIKHPNYVAVMMELAATPLLGKSYVTFAVAFTGFLVVLYYRIRLEEEALTQHTDYSQRMASKRRFFP